MGFVTRAAILLITAATTDSAAQTQRNSPAYLHSEDSQGKVIVVALAHPVYPPVARLANTTGDVEVKLTVRRDGSVESARVLSGPPMLQQAALNSAQQSRFECRGCAQELTSQSFIYSFQLIASPGWPCPERGSLRVSQTDDHITIIGELALVLSVFLLYPNTISEMPISLVVRQPMGRGRLLFRASSLPEVSGFVELWPAPPGAFCYMQEAAPQACLLNISKGVNGCGDCAALIAFISFPCYPGPYATGLREFCASR